MKAFNLVPSPEVDLKSLPAVRQIYWEQVAVSSVDSDVTSYN